MNCTLLFSIIDLLISELLSILLSYYYMPLLQSELWRKNCYNIHLIDFRSLRVKANPNQLGIQNLLVDMVLVERRLLLD